MRSYSQLVVLALLLSISADANSLERIRVSNDGTHFVGNASGKRFIVWGVNYDHDSAGRLLDEYWIDEWGTVVEDFREIKGLGVNCVRIHLQIGKFMEAPNEPNTMALARLTKLVKLAEDLGLYLDVTGLACYHKSNIPAWYDELSEKDRWAAQAVFWEAVARSCKDSHAIFCYDLMNEPILPGQEPATEWLTGELGGKYFVQRLTLDLKGRQREQVAEAWVGAMTRAIRKHDEHHMITVGVIPWVFVFGGGKPLFHSPRIGKQLDFVAVHFYPEKGKIAQALDALKAYEVGKPLVIEEMFPLKCTEDELAEFVATSAVHADGWISFYWGTPARELLSKDDATIAEAITASWLNKFSGLRNSGVFMAGDLHCTPRSPLATGDMVVCWEKQTAKAAPRHLLVHFHGAPEAVKKAFIRSELDAVLVVVNFPGLSSAYSRPFEVDAGLFRQILQRATGAVTNSATGENTARWQRISVSSFSAGYGAVREILKTPSYFEQIDSIVAADSIYAGLQQEQPKRQVNRQQMRDFLKFASLAVDEKKTFVISHSTQATPYASTTETADYLLRSLKLQRRPNTSIQTKKIRQLSQAARGRFLVLGFDGESGPAHMQHLHNIDLFWKRLSDESQIAKESHSDAGRGVVRGNVP